MNLNYERVTDYSTNSEFQQYLETLPDSELNNLLHISSDHRIELMEELKDINERLSMINDVKQQRQVETNNFNESIVELYK